MLTKLIYFLADLEKNNNKIWFNNNKSNFDKLRLEFNNFVEELMPEMYKIDDQLGILSLKDCIFRQNRDIRFSKDKSPYKTSMSGVFSTNKKNGRYPSYYFQINSSGTIFIGIGVIEMESKEIFNVRKNILKNQKKFIEIVQDPLLVSQMGDLKGEKLKRYPRGFENEDNDYLKYKSFLFNYTINIEEIENYLNLNKLLIQKFSTGVNFVRFLRKAMHEII